MDDSWKSRLIERDEDLRRILSAARRVAVLGIKTEAQAGQPAFEVPKVLQRAGFEIVPVPTYFPDVQAILGQKVHRTVASIEPPADLVQVFRKPADLPGHLEDLLAARPKVVWMQLGISHPEVAEQLAKAGIEVVQNRCMKIELARLGRTGAGGPAR